MSRTLGGTDTGLSVASGLVGEGHFTEVAADHVELDFDVVEGLSVVDGDVVAHHFGHYDGVPEVSFNGNGLFSSLAVLFRLLAFLVQSDVFVLNLCIETELLLEKRLRILALKSSTTCSWVSSLTWSGVSPLKLYLLSPFSFLGAVLILWSIIFILNIYNLIITPSHKPCSLTPSRCPTQNCAHNANSHLPSTKFIAVGSKGLFYWH